MRLPYLRSDELSEEQRPLFNEFAAMVKTAEFHTVATRRDDGAFLGPFAVMLHFPDAGAALAEFTKAVGRLPGLSPAARQVVILTVGGRYNAAYELYAHSIEARAAGLHSTQIATLCAGGRPADLTVEQTLAADVAVALCRGGVLPDTTARAVIDLLGQPALDAIVLLTVQYQAICALLNAYDVPAPRSDEEGR